MKLLHTILPIAILIQLSMAATIGRTKRDTHIVNGIKEIIDLYKRAVPAIEAVLNESLLKMPNEAVYLQYRLDVQQYLEAVEEHKTKPGPCVDKIFAIVTQYDELMEEYEKEDAPKEAKLVFELISGDERIKSLEREMDAWSVNYDIEDLNETVDNLSYEDAIILVPLVVEVC